MLARPGRANEPPRLEDAVLTEVNYVRTHPHDYADELRRHREFFDGRVVHLPGDEIGVMTREGTVAVDEAIEYLDRQAPLPPLAYGEVLALAAHDLAEEQGETGYSGHRSANGASPGDRVKRRGGDIFVGETISYGYDDPGAVVRQLVIDDGVAGRGHRGLIFAAGNNYAAVGCGPHPRDRFLCVIDYSTTPNGAPTLPGFATSRR
ncbi:MAG: CAP domain-containing protein [Sphingomonas bacterium]